MRPMSEFDPNLPARVHDRRNDKILDWRTRWANDWRRHAITNKLDGTVSFDGLVLDGWEPISKPS